MAEANRRDQDQQSRQALFGSALPVPSSEVYRGLLIRNKTMIKQLKHGERLLAHFEDLGRDVLDTLVQGLLHYQMPEVPNLNTTIQGFIGAATPAPRLNRERTASTLLFPGTREMSQTVLQGTVSKSEQSPTPRDCYPSVAFIDVEDRHLTRI